MYFGATLKTIFPLFIAVAMLVSVDCAYGEDFEAVERRLKSAVERGEISTQQAHRMLKALDATERDEPQDDRNNETEELLEFVEQGLHAAVELGVFSEEEAEDAMEEIIDHVRHEEEDEEDEDEVEEETEEHLAAIGDGLKSAVELRLMSEKEAKEIWMDMTEELRRRKSDDRNEEEHFERIGRGLESAVELELMSEEEAREVWQELREKRAHHENQEEETEEER